MTERRSDDDHADKVKAVQQQVEEVSGIMDNNIKSVINNQEKVSTIVDSTNDLREDAKQFERRGESLKRQLWLRNMKLKIILAVVVLVVLVYVITVAVA